MLKKVLRMMERMFERRKVHIGLNVKPRFINFSLTRRCNSRCIMCNIWKNKDFSEELTFEEIKSVFERDKRFLNKVEFVQITGGEPLLREDVVEIVTFLCSVLKGLDIIWVITNGLATEMIIEKVRKIAKACNKLAVSTSLEGRRKTHDKMRGIPGGYDKTVKTIKELVKLRDREFPWLTLSVGLTVSKLNDNPKEILHVYNLARKFNIGFSLRPVQVSPIYYENLEKSLSVPPEKAEELKKVFKFMLKDDKKSFFQRKEEEFYYYGVYHYIKDPSKFLLPCYAGSLSFFLTEKGDVYPCVFVEEKLGNVMEKSLKEILTSKRARKIRRKLLHNKCPNCWVECESQRNATYHPEKVFLLGEW